jgi:NADH-quinone oxidoreductase subunit F
MDLTLHDAEPTIDERAAVDALLGPPASSWEGGTRDPDRDLRVAIGGHAARARRHQLLPALNAVQARVGWISEGALNYLCARLTVPPAEAWGVATFYALLATAPRPRRVLHVCDDIACRCRGAGDLAAELERRVGPEWHARALGDGDTVTLGDEVVWMRSPCLGRCDEAPAALYVEAGATPVERSLGAVTLDEAIATIAGSAAGGAREASESAGHGTSHGASPARHAGLLLARVGVVDPASLDAYRAAGGYEALARAVTLGSAGVIREVIASNLVGRGGAAFPMGRKWDAVAHQPVRPRYLVCNADESEPGTFKDRVLLEGDPFAVVEAMTIAAFACGCEHGYLYVRGEYPLARARLVEAIAQARAHGFLGADVMGHGFAFDIELRVGAGAYICGEETAIFNSIEGFRGEPRNKPPFPVEAGLFGKPTVVNNVETLVNVLPILLHGGEAFARVGTAQSTGTKLFCLSGCVQRPGVYEVPFGGTLRGLIDLAGGVGSGRRLAAVLLGGAAGVFVRPDELDMPLTLEGARVASATLGSGVVMVFDDTVDLESVLLRIAAFFRDESCGQCVPCRVGTVRQEEALHRIHSGRTRGGVAAETALLDELGVAMRDASICGLGQTAYSAVESAIHRLRLYEPTTSGGAP